VAGAAARVLSAAGESVSCWVDACCGWIWISTGQLDATIRLPDQAAQLLDDAPAGVAARVRSFAAHVGELADAGWKPSPAVALPSAVVLQTRCHEYSVFGGTVQR
jgi:hypothetical protein